MSNSYYDREPVRCPPDDVQRGEERPLVPQPAYESPGSLWLGSVQLWEQILGENSFHQKRGEVWSCSCTVFVLYVNPQKTDAEEEEVKVEK